MTYSAVAIANAFIDVGRERGSFDLTPMKLQKLVYFAHGWNLGAVGQPLINERVEAWPYGPVVPSIYHAAKMYGNQQITNYLSNPFDPFLRSEHLTTDEFRQVSPLLNWVWDQYGQYSGIQLSNMTHEPDTPWYMIASTGAPNNTDIPDRQITEYFQNKYHSLM